MALKNGTQNNVCRKHSFQENRTTFSDVPLLPEILPQDDLKSCVSLFLFPTGFLEKNSVTTNVTLLADHQVNANMQGKMSPCKMYEGHPMKATLVTLKQNNCFNLFQHCLNYF